MPGAPFPNHGGVRCCASRVRSDHRSPKCKRGAVRLSHSNGPLACQLIPEEAGGLASDTRSPIRPEYEELGDIIDGWVAALVGQALHQNESRYPAGPPNDERKAALRVARVQRQRGVAEATVGPELDVRENGAEVVSVEFEEVREEDLVGWRRGGERDGLNAVHLSGLGPATPDVEPRAPNSTGSLWLI